MCPTGPRRAPAPAPRCPPLRGVLEKDLWEQGQRGERHGSSLRSLRETASQDHRNGRVLGRCSQ